MYINFFSVLATFIWSSVLIVIFYLLRKRVMFSGICSVSGVIVLYVFCMVRLAVPLEFKWMKIIWGGTFLNEIYRYLRFVVWENPRLWLYHIFFIIWGVVSVVLLLRIVKKYRALMKLIECMPVAVDDKIFEIFRKIAPDTAKLPEVRMSDTVNVPCCVGIIRKRIILPNRQYSDKELYYILLHEYSHLQNNDTLVKMLINVLCAIYCWNPCVYLLKRDMSQSIEIRCDETVVRHTGFHAKARSEYLNVILEQFKNTGNIYTDSAFVGLFENHSDELVERFKHVANTKKYSANHGKYAAWIIAACLLVLSYSFMLQTFYEAPIEDIENDENAYAVTQDDSYIIRKEDGTYVLVLVSDNIQTVIKEEAAQMMESSGFKIIDEGD